MKITRVNRAMEIYKTNQAEKVKKTGKTEAKKDVLALSNTAKEYQLAMKAAMQAPDIRKDKVQDIKNKLNSGTYNVTAHEVAEKIVDHQFDTQI